MALDWPSVLVPHTIDLFPIEQTRSANRSLSGFQQVTEGVTGRWGYVLKFATLAPAGVLAFRGLKAALRGRSQSVKVPVFDPGMWPTDAEITASISGTAGDTTATVNLSSVPSPSTKLFAGHYFGAGDDLHIIKSTAWSGSAASITFWPALRSNKSGAAFKLRPSIICRLSDDLSGRHPLERGRLTAPTLELEEFIS